jgi:Kef-type K+ transport system membrane component KefB
VGHDLEREGPGPKLSASSRRVDDFARSSPPIFRSVRSPAPRCSSRRGLVAASILRGALLGTVTALLLRGAEGDAVWGALVGTLLLGVGAAARFGLATIFVTFVMGIALAAVSPARRTLRRMVGATERAVLYPLLLLAGAHLDPRPVLENRALGAVVALVLLARIVGKLVSGLIVRFAVPAARPAGPALGIVLLSSGPVTVSYFAFVPVIPARRRHAPSGAAERPR